MTKKFLLTLLALLTTLSMVLSAVPVFAGEGNSGKGQSKIQDKIQLFKNQKAAALTVKALKAKAEKAGTASAAIIVDPATGLMVPDYFGVANWAYSPPLTKFIDKLPGLGPTEKNNLNQYSRH